MSTTTTTTTKSQHDWSRELDFNTVVIGNYDDLNFENNEPIISSSVIELVDMLRSEKQRQHIVNDSSMASSSSNSSSKDEKTTEGQLIRTSVIQTTTPPNITTEKEYDCVDVSDPLVIAPAVVKSRRGKGLQKCAKTSAERTMDSSMKLTRIIRDMYLMHPRGYRGMVMSAVNLL